MTLGIVLGCVLLLAVVLTPVLTGTAHRLDRLHIRTDAAHAGLHAALARRAVVVRAAGAGLRALADAAECAGPAERQVAEDALTAALATLDRSTLPAQVAEELADAEARMVFARRVYNDAVRATRALRERRLVRLLHLAGTAPLPEYFEIVEPRIDSPIARFAREVPDG